MDNYTNIRFEQYLQYIHNTGGKPLVSWFDNDWEPIGPIVRQGMEKADLIEYFDTDLGQCMRRKENG